MNLWQHQQKAVELAKTQRNIGLFFDAGTGKTATAIHILRDEYNAHKRIKRTLIFTPLSVCPQWKTEFSVFSKVPPEKIHVLTGAGAKRTKKLQELIDQQASGIIVTNYEAVLIKAFYESLTRWSPELLILDELHRCKDAASQRNKKIYPLAQQARRRIGLTGTPILNTMLDLFGQFKLLDSTIFGTNFFAFRLKYFYDKNAHMPKHVHFPDWQPRPEAAQQLGRVVAEHTVQAKKAECIDLPPFVEVPVPVVMGAKQLVAYKTMEKHFIAEMAGVVSTAQFAMTKTLRLQQILCGFVQPDEEGDPAWFDEIPRLKALEDILDSLGGAKTIVWTTYRATYPKIKSLCDRLGLKSAMLIGGQSSATNTHAIDNFRHGDASVLISNPASGGVGVNLTEAPYAIYYHKGYSLEHYLQSSARNFRGGSTMHERVTQYHLYSPGTLDEVIHQTLVNKGDIAEAVLLWARKGGGANGKT